MSADCKTATERAMIVAQENLHNYIGTEHLLKGLIELHDQNIETILKANKVSPADITRQLDTVLTNASQFPQINEVMDAIDKIQDNMSGHDMPKTTPPPTEPHKHKTTNKKDSALDFFATNLTDEKMQKNIDPIIGRDQEIERLIQILCRRTKNNPVLLGDPGVGKTAIVEGLAKHILQNKVPDILLNKKISLIKL